MANRGAQKRKTLARKAAQKPVKPKRHARYYGHYPSSGFGLAAVAAMLTYESRRR